MARNRPPVGKTFVVFALGLAVAAGLSACSSTTPVQNAAPAGFLATLGKPTQVGSTVPSNGDVNPYGVAVVPTTIGALVQGDTLVSNFNDQANTQGTGSTIIEISPNGAAIPFAQIGSLPSSEACPGGIGLSTALSILPGGWVVVGSMPTGLDGALPNADPAGCLIVLNSTGTPVETWSNQNINGPWDMTTVPTSSGAEIFVSNVLSRSSPSWPTPPVSALCTVTRIDVSLATGTPPVMTGSTVIGNGFPWRANQAALVQGPTGSALGKNGTLYVAETIGSLIVAIPNALSRTTAVSAAGSILTSGGFLNGPLGMTLAPNGDVIAMNGNDGNVVEISPAGHQIAKVSLVPNGAGDLFGATIAPDGQDLLFVNDGTNSLDIAAKANSGTTRTSPTTSTTSTNSSPTTTGGSTTSTTQCTIPQNNGGDQDADNNGGPGDGDGCDK